LVHDLGLATQVSVEYSPAALDPTPFALVAVPTSKVDLPTLERAIDSEIGTLRKDGIQKADLHRAKQTLRADVLRARDGTYRSALVTGMALASGATLEEFEAWPDRIGAVTLDQVRDEVRAILRPEASATGLLVARKE
jgi:zinc protease